MISFLAIGAAIFFFVVKPMGAIMARMERRDEGEEISDDERRHQELLAALRTRA